MLSGRGGDDQPERVGAGLLLSAGLLDAVGEPGGERVAAGGCPGVDGPPHFPVLRRLDVQVPGDLDHLAVHRDDPGGLVDLAGGQGGQLAPPQPAVGSGVGHKLVAFPVPPSDQCPAQLADVAIGRDLGWVDPQRRLAGDADLGRGKRAAAACQCSLASRGLARYPPSRQAATRAEIMP